jgi:hypothetical protein
LVSCNQASGSRTVQPLPDIFWRLFPKKSGGGCSKKRQFLAGFGKVKTDRKTE